MYPSSSPLCWRCNEHIGNLHHTLWSCKNLQSFWKTISKFIADLTGNLIELTPAMALLGLNLDSYPSMFRTIVTHILIAARISISTLWKSCEAPNLTTVIIRLNIQAQYELMLAYKNYHMTTFKKEWQDWIAHPRASHYLQTCNL